MSYLDLVEYFKNEREESDKIEYKSFVDDEDSSNVKSKEKGILRTICAFLNSEGGILIWGAPKGQKVLDRKGKICKGELSLVDKHYEKDEFISKIANRITPSPKGIKFHRVDDSGKYAYVIEVPKSDYSPHQFENVYSMRLDGQSVSAPHHYVEALFKKISFPKLEGYIKPVSVRPHVGNKIRLRFDSYIFNLSPLQNDFNLTYRIICDPGEFDSWINNTAPRVTYGYGGQDKRVTAPFEVFHYGQPLLDLHTLIIDPYLLERNNFVVTILLSFGAKLSPLLSSNYKIKIPLDWPEKWNVEYIEQTENIYSHEIKMNSGATEEESIKKILGRD